MEAKNKIMEEGSKKKRKRIRINDDHYESFLEGAVYPFLDVIIGIASLALFIRFTYSIYTYYFLALVIFYALKRRKNKFGQSNQIGASTGHVSTHSQYSDISGIGSQKTWYEIREKENRKNKK